MVVVVKLVDSSGKVSLYAASGRSGSEAACKVREKVGARLEVDMVSTWSYRDRLAAEGQHIGLEWV